MVFTTAQKVTKHLGYFCNKICCQEIPKIAQSGHTSQQEREKPPWHLGEERKIDMGRVNKK